LSLATTAAVAGLSRQQAVMLMVYVQHHAVIRSRSEDECPICPFHAEKMRLGLRRSRMVPGAYYSWDIFFLPRNRTLDSEGASRTHIDDGLGIFLLMLLTSLACDKMHPLALGRVTHTQGPWFADFYCVCTLDIKNSMHTIRLNTHLPRSPMHIALSE